MTVIFNYKGALAMADAVCAKKIKYTRARERSSSRCGHDDDATRETLMNLRIY